MVENFNIRNSNWNPSFLYHSHYCDLLTDIVDFMNLYMSKFTNQVPIRYLNNSSNYNLVIDLMFLHPNSLEFNNHTINLEWRLSSDYAPLITDIAIYEEHIFTKKHTIIKNSEEESKFIAELINSIKRLNMLWDALDTNNFLFFSFIFLILYWFCFLFLFLFLLDDEKTHDTTVTWQVT